MLSLQLRIPEAESCGLKYMLSAKLSQELILVEICAACAVPSATDAAREGTILHRMESQQPESAALRYYEPSGYECTNCRLRRQRVFVKKWVTTSTT